MDWKLRKPKIKTMFVYRLIDPRDNSTFYVGMTDNLQKRLKQHIFGGRGHGMKKRIRIKSIQTDGQQPIMEMLSAIYIDIAEISDHTGHERRNHANKITEELEWKWITFYRSMGTELTNSHLRFKYYCRCNVCSGISKADAEKRWLEACNYFRSLKAS